MVLSVLNSKYVHSAPAPWCLAAGIKAFAPEFYGSLRVVEANINQPISDIAERIVKYAPALVGLSCYIWNIEATIKLCAELKRALPWLLIVLGGPEVSYNAKEVLEQNPEVDYILSGEGEEGLPLLLRALLAGDRPLPLSKEAGEAIAGLHGRDFEGGIYKGETAPPIIGSPPSPLSAGYAPAVKGRIAYFETSRGCPYSCAFCLSGSCGPARFFDLSKSFEDLLILANSGARTIKFVDRTFNANAAHANKILDFILSRYGGEIPEGSRFHFEIAGDILKEETFALLERMPIGAVQLEIGIQSFSEKTLEAVNRKTDIDLLQKNIRRLLASGNMHIHIDLIAGLPYEGLESFALSFDRAYELGAHMLQLGFLKLLHGSELRAKLRGFIRDFDEKAPYEVRSTPWISAEELGLLRHVEAALDRVYNSGRFSLSAAYAISASGLSPFEFYKGLALYGSGTPRGLSLDDFTAIFQNYCALLPSVDGETLRDELVRDRLASNASGSLPPCLYREDKKLTKRLRHRLAEKPETAPAKGLRRGLALLYGRGAVCWADYAPEERDPLTGRWQVKELPFEALL